MAPTLTRPRPVDLYVGALHPALGAATSLTITTASAAHFTAFQVNRPATVSAVYFRTGVQSGNIDIGVYSVSGTTATRVASTGSFPCPAVAIRCTQALTASVTLIPGVRYLQAIAADNTTAGFGGYSGVAPAYVTARSEVGVMSSAFPLPATLDLTLATDSGKAFVLLFA
jgi:hypothetical protein